MKKNSIGAKLFNIANLCYLTIVSVAMFLPFWVIISVSFSSEKSVSRYGYSIWPKEFSIDAFRFIFERGTVQRAYGVSVFVTLFGTALAVLITAMIGYSISRNHLKYRNHIAMFVYFTMIFSGGLVPWYITVSKLGIKDSIWALILPALFTPWNMFLIRNYFQTIPPSLIESGKLDGAGDLRIFFVIVLPIALPGLATISLFYMLGYWNDWWLALNFINKTGLYPLQFLLRQVLSNIAYASSGITAKVSIVNIPTETVKMATCMVTIGPIILVYPFIQKYFIKGLTVGAIKG